MFGTLHDTPSLVVRYFALTSMMLPSHLSIEVLMNTICECIGVYKHLSLVRDAFLDESVTQYSHAANASYLEVMEPWLVALRPDKHSFP